MVGLDNAPQRIAVRPADMQRGAEGRGRGECMGMGIGHTGGEVVGLVDDQEGAGRIEARLFLEEGAVPRGEDVVVVADPEILERQRRARDLVRADQRVAARGPERLEVLGRLSVEVEAGEPARGPALADAVEIAALFAHAVEGVIYAVLGLAADLPDRDDLRQHRGIWDLRLGI